jgi:hypothetical protein
VVIVVFFGKENKCRAPSTDKNSNPVRNNPFRIHSGKTGSGSNPRTSAPRDCRRLPHTIAVEIVAAAQTVNTIMTSAANASPFQSTRKTPKAKITAAAIQIPTVATVRAVVSCIKNLHEMEPIRISVQGDWRSQPKSPVLMLPTTGVIAQYFCADDGAVFRQSIAHPILRDNHPLDSIARSSLNP